MSNARDRGLQILKYTYNKLTLLPVLLLLGSLYSPPVQAGIIGSISWTGGNNVSGVIFRSNIRPGQRLYIFDSKELVAGLQSFPMLVLPDKTIGYPQEDGRQARRTVIAEDEFGRIVLLVASTGTFTLHQMSRFLVESDIQLVHALNLDGGASSGILVTEPLEGIAPFSLLPAVITATTK